MGAAFAGISYFLNDMQFLTLNKGIACLEQNYAEIRRDVAEGKRSLAQVRQDVAEVKQGVAEMKRGIQKLLQKEAQCLETMQSDRTLSEHFDSVAVRVF